jgi:hypothetical protein
MPLSIVGSTVSTNLGGLSLNVAGNRYLVKTTGFQYLENKLFTIKIVTVRHTTPNPNKILEVKNEAA